MHQIRLKEQSVFNTSAPLVQKTKLDHLCKWRKINFVPRSVQIRTSFLHCKFCDNNWHLKQAPHSTYASFQRCKNSESLAWCSRWEVMQKEALLLDFYPQECVPCSINGWHRVCVPFFCCQTICVSCILHRVHWLVHYSAQTGSPVRLAEHKAFLYADTTVSFPFMSIITRVVMAFGLRLNPATKTIKLPMCPMMIHSSDWGSLWSSDFIPAPQHAQDWISSPRP